MQSEQQHARQLVAQLDHPVAAQRKAAAQGLLQLPASVSEPVMTAALPKASVAMRRRILMVLAQMDAPKAIPVLMQYTLNCAQNPTDDTRPLAMRAILRSLRPRHALHCFDFFLQHRRDQDPLMRAAAFEGLSLLADARARPILEDSSRNDPDTAARQAALNALNALNAQAPQNPPSSDVIDPARLRELLASRDAEQRALAVRELIRRSHPDALAAFRDALASNHALARESALIGLGALRDPSAAQTLLSIAQNEINTANERALALRAISQLPPSAPLSAIEHILRSAPDVFIRAAALAAFAAQNPPANHLDPLLDHLDHSESFVRDAAREGLRHIASSPDAPAASAARALLATT